jgi:hypothetical protein
MEDKEVLKYVIDGFKLIPAKHGFANSYVTKTGKASDALSKVINARIKKNFPNSNIRTRVERNYHTLNFYRHMQESFADKATNIFFQLMEGFTSLQTTSFRDRPSRIETFIDKLKTNSEFTLKNGDAVSFKDAVIVKQNPVVDPKNKEKEPQKEFTFSNDNDEFAKELDKLEPGDRLTLVGSDDKIYKVSDIAKTQELGGKGKGIEQPGKKSENTQLQTLNTGLEGGPFDIKVIDYKGKSHILKGIKEAIPIKGQYKADMALVGIDGSRVYIQLKQIKHRQLEGLVRSNFAKDKEGKDLIIAFAQKVKAQLEKGRLKEPYVEPIDNKRLQILAVYGTNTGESTNESAVTMYCIGNVKLEDIGNKTKKLTADTIYFYPEVPADNPPVLAAIDKGGRFQKMPSKEKTNERLADVRLGIYFKNSVPNH